jgi:hypothetical protein
MSPPPEVAVPNEKLQDPVLRDLPETKHWLSLYGHDPNIYSFDNFHLSSLLRKSWDSWVRPDPNPSITVSQIQEAVFEQAKLLIALNQTAIFESFMETFVTPYAFNIISRPDWLGHGRFVLLRIISQVAWQRSLSWQRDPNRQSATLPNTLKYELLLLPYPTADGDETQVTKFVASLKGYLQHICREENAYHEELPQIYDATFRVVPERWAQAACVLGRLEDDPA